MTHRSSYYYQSRKVDQTLLRMRIRELAATRVRYGYGYKRIHVMLQREGWEINVKRVYRLYKEEGLQMRNKTPKRRVAAKLGEDRYTAKAPNEVWAMDFVHYNLYDGRKIRCLTIVDIFSKVSPAIGAAASYRGGDVVETLEIAV
ncbi:IS3 family transposase [Paremcibacter congregatus]|uniref:IS3 family transposase n=1 Tax=Paremcibacter congregatus TaxID=2043170 RepID=UPI003A908077